MVDTHEKTQEFAKVFANFLVHIIYIKCKKHKKPLAWRRRLASRCTTNCKS